MIGAVLLVLASVLLSEVTKAWLLYFGLVFLFMVMYAPGGIASLVMMNVRVAKFGKFTRLLRPYAGLLLAGLLVVAGASALIEMIYHIQLNAGTGSQFRFVGVSLDTENHMSWLVSAAVLAVGLVGLEFARRAFVRVWSGAQEEIEAEIKQREPA
jgi:branched-chain amino acid transport system permease protein